VPNQFFNGEIDADNIPEIKNSTTGIIRCDDPFGKGFFHVSINLRKNAVMSTVQPIWNIDILI
jgi:hypothetical protein